MSRDKIECPQDTIPYNCSIQSNSETVQLTWHVTIPNMTSITITYFNNTNQQDSLTSHISTSVTGFQRDEYIHSVLEVTVYTGIPTDAIMLQCSILGLGNDSIIVNVNSSGECL